MTTQTFRSDCTDKLSKLKPHSTFLTVHNYYNVNTENKLADWSIVFHISYHNALKRAIKTISEITLCPTDCLDKPFSFITLLQARAELLVSWDLSLRGLNSSPSADSYDDVTDCFGKPIPGIKLHREQDLLHLWGFVVHSRIIQHPTSRKPEHCTLTHAKKFITAKTSLSRWVQFRLEPGRFDKIVVQDMTIRDYEVVRKCLVSDPAKSL